jgi:hypothetical protein
VNERTRPGGADAEAEWPRDDPEFEEAELTIDEPEVDAALEEFEDQGPLPDPASEQGDAGEDE